ncbi:bifunctional nicotinamidase/pyrazinamidase [Methylovirgula sp. HY1]|uniref:bifunctional nicotinamidase/pyrazinamidase n=1 Tax=Methylovirgula sp. HY1 TaxID=2822761 RepID=UPI001C5B8E62|nr:bifunctional nicotinamidase/pyrazinamidase [Methylovirgula sp. HY1]QXX76432.1 Nicotinamidase [Methylovirgula sp. HY1]
MSGRYVIEPNDVLLVVDIQNDFCPGGALPVPEGDAIVPILNRVAQGFANVVLAQDWHPRSHISFASAHPGCKPFQTVEVAYGSQTLWPDHCVQGRPGADFHPALEIPQTALILRKGLHQDIDSYSAFKENDRKTATGLAGYLRERGLTRIFIAGLAYDFCVRYSAEDAKTGGFDVVIVEDACRGLDIDGSMTRTKEALFAFGCANTISEDIIVQ